jgi:hypothetical protein
MKIEPVLGGQAFREWLFKADGFSESAERHGLVFV